MRKQIGFDVISENISDGNQKQVLLGRVQRYLDDGWEVIGTHVPQTGAQSITVTVVFGKYEYYGDWLKPVTDGEEKRGPGRPKKAEEVVPA